ncbi:MAG: hypothetical protein ABJB11_13005 [Ferruginibacter sp.]
MKKVLFAALGFAAVFASCKKVDQKIDVQKPLISGVTLDTLRGDILVNTTVTKNSFLDGIVYVRPGVTLTVNPGITIYGKTTPFGTPPDLVDLSNNKGTLVVEKGAKLMAVGTPTQPIIWTSYNTFLNLPRNVGDWGGPVLLGNAPIVTATGATTNDFEAFAALTNGRNSYGGANAADNSGTITYNRFEFGGGTVTAPNAEVNGFTLCGVGSGTTINHIEVANAGDDGFEFFGGTVNMDHLLSYSNKDDDFDFDEGYRGNLQFIIAYRSDLADNSGSELIELDNNSAAAAFPGKLRTRPFIANATLIGPASATPRVNPGGTSQAGRFDGGPYIRRNGRIVLLNSLIISQAMPTAFATTATTNASFFGARPPLADDSSAVLNNIFQAPSATPVVMDLNESNPIVTTGIAVDNALINDLGAKGNTALGVFGDFKLGGLLENQSNSPSKTGGINLAALGLPFVGTTERGAVISTDVWTNASWISIALN